MLKVYQSLTQEPLLAGVTRKACIAHWTIVASLTLGAKLWWLLGFGLIGHFMLRALTHKDAGWFEALRGYLNQPKRLEP